MKRMRNIQMNITEKIVQEIYFFGQIGLTIHKIIKFNLIKKLNELYHLFSLNNLEIEIFIKI
jgi:hypothetical protein